jgi:hypothetical protein
MRTKSDKPGNPVKEVAGTVGNVAPDIFPAIAEEQSTGVYEILPGMTVEEMTAMFFDEKTLIEPPYKVWQLNSKGHRYYYRYDDYGNPEFFPSVTTILSQTLPKAPHLINWIANKGIEEAERYKGERAAYGTFMHAAFEELLINRAYDLDGLKGKLKEYIEVYRLPEGFIYYADDLKKDVLAFAQFVLDYDVRPLAVEIALVHPYYKYAGMIDCPCTMRAKIGSDDRINAIVDFKSGRKGFYEESEIQLGMYRDMWNVNFEQFPVTRIFNFSPKDWRKKPSYNLKEQTESPNIRKIPYLLEIATIEDEKRDNTFTAVNGMVVLDDNPDLSQNVISLSLAELIKTKAPKEATPDETTDAADTVKADAVAPEQTPESYKAVTVEDLKPEPEQKKQMTCSEFEVTINDVAPYSLWEVTDIAKVNGVELVEKGLNLDEHRWYSIATNIYKCSDGYVKVTGAYQSFSEAQTWEDINVFSEAEKLQGKELQAFELRMKAYEIENEPEQSPEPTPEPEIKKTKIVKRTGKTAKEAAKKPATGRKAAKRTVTPEREQKPADTPKKPQNENKKILLNDDPEI